jgi:hypothetical protein
MQVDRKPSRWPYAVTLVYLAILCLTVPRYWRSGDDPAEQQPGKPAGSAKPLVSGHVPYDPTTQRHLELLEPSSRLSVDELLSALDDLNGQTLHRNEGPVVESPVWHPDLSWPGTEPLFGSAATDELVAAALRHVGRRIAEMSPHELTLLAPPATETPQPAPPRQTATSHSSIKLRLVTPNDRVAMVPPSDRRPTPVVAPQVVSSPPRPPVPPGVPCPWSTPVALLEQLELLSHQPYSAGWARETTAQLKSLTANNRLQAGQAAMLLSRLRSLSDEAAMLAEETDDDVLRAELLRAHWGLERRLDCWSPMREIAARSTAARRMAARTSVLSKFSFLPGQVVESVDIQSLSADLEAYEQEPTPRLAWAIREKQRELRTSSDIDQIALADAVDEHYRNANVRIAVTGDLLNRLVERERTEMRRVHERIAGTPVRGRSMTVAESRIQLEPDGGRVRIGWETEGTVDSLTRTEGGPATLKTRGTTNFTARKPIMIESDGVQLPPSNAYAANRSQVVGVYSYFDWIPLIGSYIRSRAIQQYHEKRPRAEAEVEYKVANRVRGRLDYETGTRIHEFEDNFRQRVTDPLEKYGVKLEPVELQTTEERIVARVRVAGDEQLGAHTPRPTAPADSLASVQVHESALTNAALALELDGQRLTAVELRDRLREKFPRLGLAAESQTSEELPDDVVFQFAARDAVKFRLVDGVVDLKVSMAELQRGGERTRNFIVHATYRPEVDGLKAELVRDGALGIEGRLGVGERARMHNVFNEIFSTERRLPIVQLDQNVDARLNDLVITQLVVEDGWLGLAIGPNAEGRVAERSRSLR